MEDNQFDIRVLEPQDVRLFHVYEDDAIVRLTYQEDRSWIEVRIASAYPFSDPTHYIGLRDGNDKDIGLIVDPQHLDPESLKIVENELDKRYFTPQVQKVNSVQELMGTVTWDVETDRGNRRFIVRNLRDNSFPLGPNRLMVTDTDGNRYEFSKINSYGFRATQVLSKIV